MAVYKVRIYKKIDGLDDQKVCKYLSKLIDFPFGECLRRLKEENIIEFLTDGEQLEKVKKLKENYSYLFVVDLEEVRLPQKNEPAGNKEEDGGFGKEVIIKIYGPGALAATLIFGLVIWFFTGFKGASADAKRVMLFCAETISYRGVPDFICSSLCNQKSDCLKFKELRRRGWKIVNAFPKEILGSEKCNSFYCCKCEGTVYILEEP